MNRESNGSLEDCDEFFDAAEQFSSPGILLLAGPRKKEQIIEAELQSLSKQDNPVENAQESLLVESSLVNGNINTVDDRKASLSKAERDSIESEVKVQQEAQPNKRHSVVQLSVVIESPKEIYTTPVNVDDHNVASNPGALKPTVHTSFIDESVDEQPKSSGLNSLTSPRHNTLGLVEASSYSPSPSTIGRAMNDVISESAADKTEDRITVRDEVSPAVQLPPNEVSDVVMVKNLDSGEIKDATQVFDEFRSGGGVVDPISFQVSQRSKLKRGSDVFDKVQDDRVETDGSLSDSGDEAEKNKKFTIAKEKTKKFFRTMKSKMSSAFMGDTLDLMDASTATGSDGTYFEQYFKVKSRHKGKKQFNRLVLVQELMTGIHQVGSTQQVGAIPASQSVPIPATLPVHNGTAQDNTSLSVAVNYDPLSPESLLSNNHGFDKTAHGPVWALKINRDGKYLAAGGKDKILRVWLVISEVTEDSDKSTLGKSSEGSNANTLSRLSPVFHPKPYRIYKGHKADILDISWSKNDFILSSSMDKTVRLWHVSRKDCLRLFQHADFVTSIAFHPRDDRFFLSGCLDCRLRLWNIPEKKLDYWHELPESNLITSVGFTTDGKIAIAGSYLGACMFYETDGLKYNTQIHVRSSRGKNARGEKITGIEAMPGQNKGEEKILITSNDSRIRIYNMRDKSLFCKYKGLTNSSSQIKASFSDDARFIISGSEDKGTYVWNTFTDDVNPGYTASSDRTAARENGSEGVSAKSVLIGLQSLTTVRRDRNSGYESFQGHTQATTCAIFAPETMINRLVAAGLRNPAESSDQTDVSPAKNDNVPDTRIKSSQEDVRSDEESNKVPVNQKPKKFFNIPISLPRSSSNSSVNENGKLREDSLLKNKGNPRDAGIGHQKESSSGSAKKSTKDNADKALSPSNTKRRPGSAALPSQAASSPVARLAGGRIIITADHDGTVRVFENEHEPITRCKDQISYSSSGEDSK